MDLSHTKSKVSAMRRSSIGEQNGPTASEMSYVSAALSTKSKLNKTLDKGAAVAKVPFETLDLHKIKK